MSSNYVYDPFQEYINNHLNLDELEGVDLEAVVGSLRGTLAQLATDPTDNLWSDRLTSLQDMVRLCLSMDMVLELLQEKPDISGVDRADLELLTMLAVTVGFIAQNNMELSQADLPLERDDLVLARRLRTTLKSSMGWVRKAAKEGDPVAEVMMKEAAELIEDTQHFE